MISKEFITEIEKLDPDDFRGGSNYLSDVDYDLKGEEKLLRKLPGNSGLLYAIKPSGKNHVTIRIYDPKSKTSLVEPNPNDYNYNFDYQKAKTRYDQTKNIGKLVGRLELHGVNYGFPIKNALQVGTITVDENYRGVGIAKSLYGIVLTIMRVPLVAGDSQTPGGIKNWVSLSQIPGVEMKGYVSIKNLNLESYIDVLMGKLGGQYMGEVKHKDWSGPMVRHYFSFDVQPNTTGKSLENYVKNGMIKLYHNSNYTFDRGIETGLYAIWNGQ